LSFKVIRIVGPGVLGGNLGALFVIEWQVPGGVSGQVVQHVVVEGHIYDCKDGKPLADESKANTYELWEAWEVQAGRIGINAGNDLVGTKKDVVPGAEDTFSIPPPRKGTFGQIKKTGYAKFIPGGAGIVHNPFGGHPTAGDLPNQSTAPKGWSDVGAVSHSLRLRWTFCDCPSDEIKMYHTP
jgi:hypothetical protein